ncbi:hypothetical protein [Desulfoluna sp.]|uniref:hypothetical protein n=1 Tax=Desulfoluna sp. TaxID=2045199 RepID=UPI00261C66D4|nr:hypothetical protein [Desulfoluna sp.]
MTVVSMGDRLKNALCWVTEARRDHPEKKLLTLVDHAGMQFNLSPKESDALLRLLEGEKENPQ